jgi:DNA-binding HxlR family transcriptional regulator
MADAQEPVDTCPISRALAVVGNRSTVLILREAYYGTTRFDDFATRVGISESMAAARLRDLVGEGLLERRPYQEPGQRTRYEYVLSEAGADLLPVVLGLGRWGEKHRPLERPTAWSFTHSGCGERVASETRCAAGHPVPLDELTIDVPRRRDAAVAI